MSLVRRPPKCRCAARLSQCGSGGGGRGGGGAEGAEEAETFPTRHAPTTTPTPTQVRPLPPDLSGLLLLPGHRTPPVNCGETRRNKYNTWRCLSSSRRARADAAPSCGAPRARVSRCSVPSSAVLNATQPRTGKQARASHADETHVPHGDTRPRSSLPSKSSSFVARCLCPPVLSAARCRPGQTARVAGRGEGKSMAREKECGTLAFPRRGRRAGPAARRASRGKETASLTMH